MQVEWFSITARQARQRPEGMDAGSLIRSGLSKVRILQAVPMTRTPFKSTSHGAIPADYRADHVSWKVAKVILSYTDDVNRRVWQRV